MTGEATNQLLGFDIGRTERTLARAPLFDIGGFIGTVSLVHCAAARTEPALPDGLCAAVHVVTGFRLYRAFSAGKA